MTDDKLGTYVVEKTKVGRWPHRTTKFVRRRIPDIDPDSIRDEDRVSHSFGFGERADHGSLCELRARVGLWPFKRKIVIRYVEPEDPSNKEYREVVTQRVLHIQGVAQRRQMARGVQYHTSSYFYHEITIDIAHAIADEPDDEKAVEIATGIIGRMAR